MKTADIDTIVWLIVAVLFVVAKGWNKLRQQANKDTSKPKPPSVDPRSQSGKSMGPPRTTVVRTRRMKVPTPRMNQSAQRIPSRTTTPPVGSPTARGNWKVDPEQIRRFIEQLSGEPQATAPPPVAPPPIQEAPAPPPAPVPTTALTATMPTMAEVLARPSTPSRAAQWTEALRDRQNIRNIIISAEIIGLPKALRQSESILAEVS
ncbi:MAG TPA: hypothetical protein VL171_17165 [Verrucomicrobiae bacterium]|nr:hypothetical protein [Verrucomicrobiae bacterium]